MTDAKSADIVRAEEPKEPLEEFPIIDAYAQWQKAEGVRVIHDFAFSDLKAIDLTPWPRKGGAGVIINIPNNVMPNDSHLVEIPGSGRSEPERHMYEEIVYVVSGRGATRIWQDGEEADSFEWEAGSLFSIPLNCWYQHFNVSNEPLRYIAITEAPPAIRHYRDLDYIFNNPYRFKSRYSRGSDFFSKSKLYDRRIWRTNFVHAAPDIGLYGWGARGAGGVNVMLELADNSQKAHISEFPVGTYKKAHRHGPGAHLIILSGVGFSLFWTKDDLSDMRKCDWREGGMVVVPSDACFHQHFNTGTTRARYLAFRPSSQGMVAPYRPGKLADVSVNEGGWQIEYEDQNPIIQQIFLAELAKHGGESRMDKYLKKE